MPALVAATVLTLVLLAPDHYHHDPLVLIPLVAILMAIAFTEGVWHARRETRNEVRAKAALQESEARFRQLGNSTPVMLWMTAADRSPVFVSQPWLEFTGILESDLLADPGGTFGRLLHPDDWRMASQAFYDAISGHNRFSCEYRLRRGDGTYRWVLDSGVPRFTETGDYLGYVGAVIDIDARKQTEAALRASEQRLRMLVENVPLVQYVTDAEGRFLLLEGRGLDVLGVHGGDHIGESVFDIYEGNDDIIADVRRALAGEHVTRMVPFMNYWWEVHYTPITGPEGAITGITAVGLDVTPRERAKAAQEESEARYRLIARATIDAIWDWDLRTGHVWRSEGFSTRFGYPLESVGDNIVWWEERVHPDDLDHAAATREHFIAGTDSDLSMEYRYLRADGTYARVVNRIHAVRDEAGTATRLVGSLTDVTEQRILEQQFLHAQRMETVGRLAGGIAHDFSNLMTAIMVNAELDLISAPPPDVLREDLEEIKATAERAANLSKQLLSFARQQITEPRVIVLNDLLTNAERMLQRLIGAETVFTIERTAEETTVRIDPGQLEQVLVNMVINARDAMPAGGTLTIRTSRAGREHLLPASPGDGYVLLEVRDTGAGMTPEVQEHVFEPFFTTKTFGAGTGLGLPTSYNIVQQAGGHILLDSEVGRGSSFYIYLPFVSAVVEEDFAAPEDDIIGGSETILLVEDEEVVRRSAARALRQLGYTVIEAPDGSEGLIAAQSHAGSIALVITDIAMPKMSGTQLASEIVTCQPDARVLFLSGYTDDASLRAGITTHTVDFIAKPFTPSALALKVREILDREPASEGYAPAVVSS
ncbi:MAG TPA: PAS domain S-box protein [Dehalococcoidia bacterium]|nr:PAS domain S-box protein [Dehalococcoidia bacterium]